MGETVVIVNPTKFEDLDEVREKLAAAAAECDHPTPRLVETTEDDPGFGQTRDAIAAGASLVCALGGDGTVRAVAQELVGSGVALGLLPGGTGNLLARNLGTPLDDLGQALRIALTGTERTIDVGWLVVQPSEEQRSGVPGRAPNVHCFTVMAGVGFDAQMMADAPERIKDKVGWAAYVASGSQHLGDDGFGLDVVTDGDFQTFSPARTVLVGNCGELTGGMLLLPDARVDDGVLDVAVLTPESLGQWLGMAGRILTRSDQDGPSIDRARGRDITLRTEPPQLTEVDGDILVEATEIRAVVQPASLVVRVIAG